MSANPLDTAKYNTVAANTVLDAVIDPVAILAWRQNVKLVVDQHATEIDGKLSLSGGTTTGTTTLKLLAFTAPTGSNPNKYLRGENGTLQALSSDFSRVIFSLDDSGVLSLGSAGTSVAWYAGNAGPFYKGAGTPEGIVTAAVGAIYQRTDGGASTTLYVKQSGTGNTGWVGK